MSLIPNFHAVIANDTHKAIIKAALAEAGHAVELDAKSAADDLVLALKGTTVGTFIASEIATLKDATLTGAEKFEQVVAKAILAAIKLFAAGGVTKTAVQVEDASAPPSSWSITGRCRRRSRPRGRRRRDRVDRSLAAGATAAPVAATV